MKMPKLVCQNYRTLWPMTLLLLGVSMLVLVSLIIQETKGDCNREEIITVVSLIKDHENQLLQIDTMMHGIAQTLTWEKNLSFLFTTQSKIVPQLYMAIMMQKWVAEISYVEPQGKVFSYYGQGNETYVLFSNDYDYLWCTQALNGTGKFSDEVTCSPPRHLNDSLFHIASYVGIGLQSIHMLFFNTPLGNSTNGVLSVGVPLETLKDSISSINIHGGHLHLATRGGEVIAPDGPPHTHFVYGDNGVSVVAMDEDDMNVVEKYDDLPCHGNISVWPSHIKCLKIQGRRYQFGCFLLDAYGMELVYIAAFPCKGGVSLLKKMRTVVVILVLLIILGMVLGSYVLLHLLHRSQLQEGLLQAKLIKLKGAIQQAERKSMNKSLAFASASHDIRTSLAGITGLVGICLADAPRVSELHSNMQQINTCVTKLLGILNSILDTSKIEAGKMQPEEVEFDICQVLEESTDIFHIVGLSKGLEVIWDPCDFSIFTSTIVRGDCQRLKQIIDNLLSNAVKFTSEGHVVLRAWARKPSFKKIEVSSRKGYNLRNVLNPLLGWRSKDSLGDNYVGDLIESDPNHIEIIIEVDDTGVGIPKEKRVSIFENYVQVKESMNGGHEGTGLGLGIVQSFVRLMGGEIKIMDKTPNEKGTCFRFNILLKSCKPSDANVDDESRAERSSSLPTNSIIIKDSANSQIVRSSISSMGFRRGLARDSIHAILFVQGDETIRILQRWMEISGVEVWVIDHWRLIYSITEKIKNSLGRLGRSKSRSLASLLNTAAEFSHSKDEANKFLPLSNIEFKTSSKDYTSCVLIVIDFSHGNFPEIELTLKKLISGNESLHFKIVWLVNSNAPTDGLRRSKHVPCHLILKKPIHGSRLYALSRLIQDFGRESEHDLHKMPSSMESNKFLSNSSSFQCSSHEVFSSSLNLEHKPLNGMNIFLAEDVPILRQVATKLISRLGASVTSCENGLKTLDLIRNALRKLDSTHEGNASNDSKGFPYDAILMDCEMPFMNGYEATRLIREEERNYGLRIPIIALTAHASPEEERKTALAGMDFHLTKPLQANQLLHAINTVIKMPRLVCQSYNRRS
ncbi:probable histidine kinase 2 isoform X1 [Zingiber officinale]|uniref:probable histidine kinase 2 isoform X1 n=1 Tax=Zingiber officinale TaxID=94328 RepID=UPI001C4C50E5|nr:probable histidine kinase 2 isoform X1 [Zingiber officinale]XP_042398035.1 probable histidine kinase 2 isoform X1 [Zingiber officinale]XP_042398036.1 probable histidine kinase 2 isoform X1 [Zingiber officinale]XP_042398037.1 probable histidine kinase 2 isoform X1 [Zingiber officinale]XP_042398038.1 probable histidine kinase 2 isoform X1 [Zingiber officinale]